MPSQAPDFIDLARHSNWEGRRYERFFPNLLFALLCMVPLAALLNVFGQSPTVKTVASPSGAATLQLSAPDVVRSGLLWEARFDIRAKREIKHAVLLLDSGWLEAMSVNTLEPTPTTQTSHNGGLQLQLGDIPAGTLWRQYFQFQANPVNAGKQSQGVTLYDGKVPLLHLNRELTVWP